VTAARYRSYTDIFIIKTGIGKVGGRPQFAEDPIGSFDACARPGTASNIEPQSETGMDRGLAPLEDYHSAAIDQRTTADRPGLAALRRPAMDLQEIH
jgi:hypothetical protein